MNDIVPGAQTKRRAGVRLSRMSGGGISLATFLFRRVSSVTNLPGVAWFGRGGLRQLRYELLKFRSVTERLENRITLDDGKLLESLPDGLSQPFDGPDHILLAQYIIVADSGRAGRTGAC